MKQATRNLLKAFWLYSNYRIDSRGPMGLIMDAIDELEPEIGKAIRDSDERIDIIAGELLGHGEEDDE